MRRLFALFTLSVALSSPAFAEEKVTGSDGKQDKQVEKNLKDANTVDKSNREREAKDQAKQNDRNSRTGVTIDKDGVRK